MILLEETQVADEALPTADLRSHLRLGSGFSEDGLQDILLGSFLRAAMAAIEGRTGKALLARTFVVTLAAWRDDARQPLPLAPVQSIESVRVVAHDGTFRDIEADRWRLEVAATGPALRPQGAALPTIPGDGHAEIRLRAGFAESWAGVPADLRQAVLLLAAHYYEYRDETALSQGCMPFGVTSLIARYAPVRLGLSS